MMRGGHDEQSVLYSSFDSGVHIYNSVTDRDSYGIAYVCFYIRSNSDTRSHWDNCYIIFPVFTVPMNVLQEMAWSIIAIGVILAIIVQDESVMLFPVILWIGLQLTDLFVRKPNEK